MAPTVSEVYSFNNPLYNTFLFYASVLVLKMLIMSFLTSKKRMSKKAFANPEDARTANVKVKTDDDVERVRRAHLNDLENIPIFIFICGIYLLTGPSVGLATNLIRIYTFARIAHTIVYAVHVMPQPSRGLMFMLGVSVTVYMTLASILKFAPYM